MSLRRHWSRVFVDCPKCAICFLFTCAILYYVKGEAKKDCIQHWLLLLNFSSGEVKENTRISALLRFFRIVFF